MGHIVNIMLVKKLLCHHPRCIRNDFIHPLAMA
uniref:Choline-phosphate cytidylyltransferase 1 n=1 Tax=Rhizophora mucronata TaxID=61149 RepID=A0A2P2LEX3_RHIMU